MTKCYWLDVPDGRVMIGAWAVLIGRSPDCNIVLEGAEFSRHHLLVRLGSAGAELLPLGRQPVKVNGTECSRLMRLRAGDRIEVGPWTFQLGEGELANLPRVTERAWFLERQPGLLHLVTGPRFRVGGGADDDLIVEGWEPSVLVIHQGTGAPVLEALRRGVDCGRPLAPGERIALAEGVCVTWRGDALTVRVKVPQAGVETRHATLPAHAVLVLLEFMPRGGQLTVEVGGLLHTTQLSERRCDLVACLLQPPAPYRAGEFVPEDVVCARVWPGEKNGRTELNSLLYRLRQSLADEGIDPGPLFERKGGGLRFCLAPRARVIVR